MPFQKGNKKSPTSGRKPGMKNKSTECMRKAWIAAFDKIGGEKALAIWAAENKTDFYKLASKLIPAIVAGDKENPIELILKNVADATRTKFDSIIKSKSTS